MTGGANLLASARILNVFQYCAKALQILGSVMCLMVVFIVGFSYYGVVAVYGPLVLGGSILKAIGGGLVCAYFSLLVSSLVEPYCSCGDLNSQILLPHRLG